MRLEAGDIAMNTPKILLVDDTKLFLKLEQEYLKHLAVTVLTAENGIEALEIARSQNPDLIFMDINMPVMDGVSCCAAIKADPGLRSIPVVMVTTKGMEDSIERCRNAGCDGFLTKPLDRTAFLETGKKFIPEMNRRERRIPCNFKILFRINNQENMYGNCMDISTCGVFVAHGLDVRMDESVEVSLLVADHSDGLVEAMGRVAWINGVSGKRKPTLPQGFGVEFVTMKDESLDLVRKFIAGIAKART